ncbi:MAG: L,D-transpeptidase family protein [Paracoccaceae bacterium]|nr:L,D-transpeptidase family protein [Paracoccaceae bacterium]
MITRRAILLGLAALLPGRILWAEAKAYPVTHIIVEKRRRRLSLMHDDMVLRRYDISLGFAPRGHKRFEGDGRTPVGHYVINRKNPESNFHRSLGISYPNTDDLAYARKRGRHPGGDIFVHGGPLATSPRRRDWTNGCIAMSDAEVEEMFRYVSVGTPIEIRA